MAFIQSYLAARQRRAVGSLMSYVEKDVFQHLSPRDQERLRAKVRAVIGEYHDSVLDVVKSAADEGQLVNEDALRLIARVDSHMAAERRRRSEATPIPGGRPDWVEPDGG